MTSVPMHPKQSRHSCFGYQLLSSGADTWTGQRFSNGGWGGGGSGGRGRSSSRVLGFYLDLQLLCVIPSAPVPLATDVTSTNMWLTHTCMQKYEHRLAIFISLPSSVHTTKLLVCCTLNDNSQFSLTHFAT